MVPVSAAALIASNGAIMRGTTSAQGGSMIVGSNVISGNPGNNAYKKLWDSGNFSLILSSTLIHQLIMIKNEG